jgi:uncharacterized protein
MRPINWNKYSARVMMAIMLALVFVAPAHATGPSFPPLTGRVVDEAGVLSKATVADLTALLAKHEQATGEQVVVVTLKSLQGDTIEDFGYQLGRYWGIGQKRKNTGTILIVVPSAHQVRIEVGYGLEGKLTDAASRTIIENDILPNFRRGDFDAGVLSGTTSILNVLGGGSLAGIQAVSASPPPASEGANVRWDLLAMIVLFIVFLIRRFRRRRNGVYHHIGRSSGYGGSFGGGGASGRW